MVALWATLLACHLASFVGQAAKCETKFEVSTGTDDALTKCDDGQVLATGTDCTADPCDAATDKATCCKVAGDADRTKQGCSCVMTWTFGDTTCNGCCNPDEDPVGEWCLVQGTSCGYTLEGGNNWDYCPTAEDPSGGDANGGDSEADEQEFTCELNTGGSAPCDPERGETVERGNCDCCCKDGDCAVEDEKYDGLVCKPNKRLVQATCCYSLIKSHPRCQTADGCKIQKDSSSSQSSSSEDSQTDSASVTGGAVVGNAAGEATVGTEQTKTKTKSSEASSSESAQLEYKEGFVLCEMNVAFKMRGNPKFPEPSMSYLTSELDCPAVVQSKLTDEGCVQCPSTDLGPDGAASVNLSTAVALTAFLTASFS